MFITEEAVDTFKKIISNVNIFIHEENEKQNYLRVIAYMCKCNRLIYNSHLDTSKKEDDILVDESGLMILFDKTSFEYLKTSTMVLKFNDDGTNDIIIDNPHQASSCKC